MLEAIHRNTRVVVDLSIVKQNIKKQLAKLSPSQELYAVVKANAYGHGMIPVAKSSRRSWSYRFLCGECGLKD